MIPDYCSQYRNFIADTAVVITVMPEEGYTSVSVPEDDFERAKEYKPSDVDWGGVLVAGAEHLNENLDSSPEGYRDANVPVGLFEMAEVTPGQLEEIKEEVRKASESVETVEERTGEIEKMIESLGGRRWAKNLNSDLLRRFVYDP